MIIILVLIVIAYSQTDTISANLTATFANPPLLNLTFSNSLQSLPAFQIFTAFTEVDYEIESIAQNKVFIIRPIEPYHLLAETVTLMFNQPQDINLSIDSFVLTIDVNSGYFSTYTGPIVVCAIALLTTIYGNAGIMMVQYIQVFTHLKAINLFYYSFFYNAHNFLFFRFTSVIFQSLPENMFLNSCFFIMISYILSLLITGIVWKSIRQPTNPILKWMKRVFNYSFIIVIFKITMIPFGVGIINNFIASMSKPPVDTLLVINQILCVVFCIGYFAVFAYVVWFMHYSKIQNYYQARIHTAYRKLYMEIDTQKGYKRFYTIFGFVKALLMVISCVFHYGIMLAVVVEDFQVFIIMITRPFKSWRYSQMMLLTTSSQFFSYLVQCTAFMFKYLGITLLQNRGYFIFDTVSLVFFSIAWINLCMISLYEAYVKIRSFADNFMWERRESDRMIKMNTYNTDSLVKRDSLQGSRSRHMTAQI